MLQLSLNVCRCMLVCGKGVGVRLGVNCPCPPVRNDIVTPRHLLINLTTPLVCHIATPPSCQSGTMLTYVAMLLLCQSAMQKRCQAASLQRCSNGERHFGSTMISFITELSCHHSSPLPHYPDAKLTRSRSLAIS